jgi:hypothetical protein
MIMFMKNTDIAPATNLRGFFLSRFDFFREVDTIDTYGRTALFYARFIGNLSIVELLVEGGSDIEIANKFGKKARDVARDNNHTAIVEYLRTPLKDKRWQRRSGLAMVRSSIRDVEDQDRGPIIRALQSDDVAREIASFL